MNMPAEQHQAPPNNVQRLPTAEESAFTLTVRKARALASSSLVPKEYQGEDGLPNVMIALEVADRIGASPLQVMQNLYVVHGKPSWSSTFLIATVNACGRFTPLRFETQGGDDPTADGYRVRAVAKDKDTSELCEGTWITWAMVRAEGWHSKSGSKWKTMPEQMFRYRAAAFWTRLFAPELSLGIHTADEMQDTFTGTVVNQPSNADLDGLAERLRQRAIEHDAPAAEPEAEPEAPAKPPECDPDTGEVLPDDLQG